MFHTHRVEVRIYSVGVRKREKLHSRHTYIKQTSRCSSRDLKHLTIFTMSRSPQHFQNFDVTFPHERVVQVTLTRTGKLNCIDLATSRHIVEIWQRLDEDENLWVGIITGVGRAFCTGADLTGTHDYLSLHPSFDRDS